MSRKNGLSPERHREIGLELLRMHERLIDLECEVQNAYPQASRPSRAAARLSASLTHLRAELANRWFAENRGVKMDAYWPPADAR